MLKAIVVLPATDMALVVPIVAPLPPLPICSVPALTVVEPV